MPSAPYPQFSPSERAVLLAVKGVGPTVVQRLQEQGYSTLAELARADVQQIVSQAAAQLGASCWKNSPQARAAIASAIAAAQTTQVRQG